MRKCGSQTAGNSQGPRSDVLPSEGTASPCLQPQHVSPASEAVMSVQPNMSSEDSLLSATVVKSEPVREHLLCGVDTPGSEAVHMGNKTHSVRLQFDSSQGSSSDGGSTTLMDEGRGTLAGVHQPNVLHPGDDPHDKRGQKSVRSPELLGERSPGAGPLLAPAARQPDRANQYASWTICRACGARLTYASKRTGSAKAKATAKSRARLGPATTYPAGTR